MASDEAAFRGSVLRAYIDTMRAEGVLDEIVARVDDETRALVAMPPTSSELVPARLTNAIVEAYHALRGEDATRAWARRANRQGIVRIIEPIIRTAMRVGGASPDAIFSRLDLILQRQQRGYALTWERVDDRSGRLRITARGLIETAASVVSWEGALAIAFDLTGTEGTVRAESRRPHEGGTVSTFLARW